MAALAALDSINHQIFVCIYIREYEAGGSASRLPEGWNSSAGHGIYPGQSLLVR